MNIQKVFSLPTEKKINKCASKGHIWKFVKRISKKNCTDLFECKRCGKEELN